MTGQPKLAASVIAALILSAPVAFPATEVPAAGSIAGVVRNSSGVPQMGATVFLFNRSEKLMARILTNERGLFGFALLAPDLYSVRVSLASFVPAVKQKIAVQPGMQSLLYIRYGERFELHGTGLCQAWRRRPDERRLEMGAEGVRSDSAGFKIAAGRHRFRSSAAQIGLRRAFFPIPRVC